MSDKEKMVALLNAVENDVEKASLEACGAQDVGCNCCGNANFNHDGCCTWWPQSVWDAAGDDHPCYCDNGGGR